MQFKSLTSGKPDTGPTAVPLFHVAWLFAVGIAASQLLWLRPSLVLMAIALVAFLCALAALRARRLVWLPLATLVCLLGAWCALVEPHPAPEPTIASLSDGLVRTMDAIVVDAGPVRGETEQVFSEDGSTITAIESLSIQRVDLHVDSLELVTDQVDRQTPTNGGVRLTVRWPVGTMPDNVSAPFHCGERVRVVIRLLRPEVFYDQGAWNREDFLLDQGITSSATVGVEHIERIGQSSEGLAVCRISSLQRGTTARLLKLPESMRNFPATLRWTPEDAMMVAAIVAGDRTYLTRSLRVGFERTGSFHMLVVSGFHLAIVAAFFFFIWRKFRVPRVPATLLTILASFGYALFTGFATPVQRSLWMVTLYLLGRLIYRERNPLNTIGFAALCLLVASPRSLFDSSLQMTLLAVVAIAGVAAPLLQGTIHPYISALRDLRLIAIDAKLPPPLAQFRVAMRMIAGRLQKFGRGRVPTFVAWRLFPWNVRFALRVVELVVVSLVVELAMVLPMAIYFHRITLFALPVNLFILPLLGVLMPAALITLGVLAVWPNAAVIPAMLVGVVLHIGVWLVQLFGSMEFGDIRVPVPLPWQSGAFCGLLVISALLAHGSLRSKKSWQLWLSCFALILAAGVALKPRPIVHPRNALFVEAIDVGQGDSLLVITPEGKTLLMDGGGIGGGPRQAASEFDMGEEVVAPALWARGIQHLDVVALSHAHSDHMGGLPSLLRDFHPDELWVGNNPPDRAYSALLKEATGLHVAVRTLVAGDHISFGGAEIGVLAPAVGYVPEAMPGNNDSLVLHVGYGATSLLLEGDAEAPVEEQMLHEAGVESTLLKVGHHGSRTSTGPEFLARVAPQFAVISCGLHNHYHHPRQEILEELQAAHVKTFRTDTSGETCFALDGKVVTAEPGCWR